jgi:TonB-linked SusC/RagA family outer membrane protein
LKDASATSIYGARAANGVIYITTKKGSANKPASITFQTQYGVSNLANTDYFENFMNTKELTDFWVATGQQRRSYINDTLLKKYPNDTKWYKYYYQDNIPLYQADLSISGGGGKTSYYLSGGYLKQQGLAYRSGYKRYTMRSNINSQVNNWLKVGLNMFIGTDERQTNPYGSNSTNRGLALLAQPFYTPLDSTGNEIYGLIPGWGRYAPKYLADKIQGINRNDQFNPSGYIQITPVKGLTLKTQAGIEAYDYRQSTVQLPSYAGSLNNGNAFESFTRGTTRTITNTGEYKFTLRNDHNFTALLGQEFIDSKAPSFSTSSTGQTDDRLILLSNGPNNRTSTSSNTEYSYLSYFSRLEYNFRNRYFVDGSLRQDQSSRFGVDNRTANFWSLGAMWKAKQESFFRNFDWLTDLSIKASTGTTGNSAIGNYQALPQVGTNTYDQATGWNINAAGNPLLSWETQLNTTFGLNFSVFNRVRVDASYYIRKTKDMLIDVPYAYTTGFSSITSNVGTLKNTGIDLAIDGDIIKTRDAYLTPYLNFNYNKNEVTELFQGKQFWIIPNTGVCWAVGQPVSFFYPIFKDVNPQTGLPEWYLPNADPNKITETRKDPNAVTSTFSPTLQQNTGIKRYPPVNGGFGLNGGFKGFYMNADFTFSQGKYLINNDRYFFENPNQFTGFNQSKTVLNYWQKAGDIATFPKYGVQFTQFDSRLIEDASFMRLKNLTVGYNLPNSILSKGGFVKAARFYVTGRNLLTFTKYTGPDPEVDQNLTLGANPNTKQVAVGLDVTF